jgi:hypothetical protein
MTRRIEYLGFAVRGDAREYALRMQDTQAAWHRFTLVISNEAFIAHRVRYQDAPDICFRKLLSEATACGDGMPGERLLVSDDELGTYKAARAPKPPVRRQPPPVDREVARDRY